MQREIFRFLSLWQNVAFFAHCYGPECGWGFLFKAKRRHPDDGALFSSICLCSVVCRNCRITTDVINPKRLDILRSNACGGVDHRLGWLPEL